MAVKKRTPRKPSAEDIEAFGLLGADRAEEQPAPASATPSGRSTPSRQLLIRFSSDQMPLAIEDAARRSGRTKTSVAIRAMQLGLREMERRGELDAEASN